MVVGTQVELANTEEWLQLVTTESLLLGAIHGSYEPQITTFLSADRHITLFSVCPSRQHYNACLMKYIEHTCLFRKA